MVLPFTLDRTTGVARLHANEFPKIKTWQYTNHRWHLAVVSDILPLYLT